MSLSEHDFMDELHPIDIVEHLAARYEWEFSRTDDNQIVIAAEGLWRTYTITFAWSDYDDMLRLVCSFDLDPPEGKLPGLYELVNAANDQCWLGSFSYWPAQKLMNFRYGLLADQCADVGAAQVETLILTAVSTAERFYPAFQLILWGDKTPSEALGIAIAEAYGTA